MVSQAETRERDWQLVAGTLRRLVAKSVLELEGYMDGLDADDFVRAQALESLGAAALHCFYLDVAAANMEARIKREAT